jgi:CheY-like chemotaxis protein
MAVSPQPPKPRVLVVDDNDATRLAFEAVLEKDFTVTAAESGAQALELCRNHEFAVIVLDVRMPGLNGFETAEALRRREETRSTPIIIFTSAFEQTVGSILRGFDAGATDFLFSPVDPDLLKLKVATYARIFLEREGMRLKIQQLQVSLDQLHAALAQGGCTSSDVEGRFLDVERTAAELIRQVR